MDIAEINIDVPRAYFILEQFVDKSFSMGIIDEKLRDLCPCRYVFTGFLTHSSQNDMSSSCFLFYFVFSVNWNCLLLGAGRDLSAREMVVSSNLKATEEPFLCARLPEEDKATFFTCIFFKIVGYKISPSNSQTNVHF